MTFVLEMKVVVYEKTMESSKCLLGQHSSNKLQGKKTSEILVGKKLVEVLLSSMDDYKAKEHPGGMEFGMKSH